MEPTPATTETRTFPRETLEAVDALERLVRRHGAVSESEAAVALKALLPEDVTMTPEEAFAIARAARPPRPPREPSPRERAPRERAPAEEAEKAPEPAAPTEAKAEEPAAPTEAKAEEPAAEGEKPAE